MPGQYTALADEFGQRIREAEVLPSTDVVLVIHTEDAGGNSMPVVRQSLTPVTRVSSSRSRAADEAWAREIHVNVICTNAQRALEGLGDELKRYRWFEQPVRVVWFELEFWD